MVIKVFGTLTKFHKSLLVLLIRLVALNATNKPTGLPIIFQQLLVVIITLLRTVRPLESLVMYITHQMFLLLRA